MRQVFLGIEPRLYGGGGRRHATADRHRVQARTRRPVRRSGCGCHPNNAGRWPDKPNTASGISEGVKRWRGRTFSDVSVLKGSSALALTMPAASVLAAAPPPDRDHARVDRSGKERGQGRLLHVDRPADGAEKIAKAFEAKYPGIAVQVERTGAERVFQRIGQEYGSGIYAVDVVNSSDAAHFHRLEARRHPRALCDRRRGEVLSRRAQGCMTGCSRASRVGILSVYRLQHHAGEGGRRAEELRRPARSEMVGQDGQGASRLQRQR